MQALLSDAHFHALDLEELDGAWLKDYRRLSLLGMASCHSNREYEHAAALQAAGLDIRISFGIHPQEPRLDELERIESLAMAGCIDAIGECGYDFFSPAYKAQAPAQDEAFVAQLGIAMRAGLALVIHVRRALPEIFRLSSELKKLPAIVFHAWPGSAAEAQALLSRGVNAYFSLGAQALNGRQLSQVSAVSLPLDRILLESDAPYQAPRVLAANGKSKYCSLNDLIPISQNLASLRGMDWEIFLGKTRGNFLKLFPGKNGLSRRIIENDDN